MMFWLVVAVLSQDLATEFAIISEIAPESTIPERTPEPTPACTQSTHPTAQSEIGSTAITPIVVTEPANPTTKEENRPDYDNNSYNSDHENLGISLLILVMVVFAVIAYKLRLRRGLIRGEDEIFDGEAQNMARYRDRLNDDANLTIDVISDEE